MNILIVEDDLVSSKVLQKYLSQFGPVQAEDTGGDGLKAFKTALDSGNPFNLVCLDIMLPDTNGRDVLKEIRAYEKEKEISYTDGVKVIMTTKVDDMKSIFASFRDGCEAYVVKPVSPDKMQEQLKKLGLIS